MNENNLIGTMLKQWRTTRDPVISLDDMASMTGLPAKDLKTLEEGTDFRVTLATLQAYLDAVMNLDPRFDFNKALRKLRADQPVQNMHKFFCAVCGKPLVPTAGTKGWCQSCGKARDVPVIEQKNATLQDKK